VKEHNIKMAVKAAKSTAAAIKKQDHEMKKRIIAQKRIQTVLDGHHCSINT